MLLKINGYNGRWGKCRFLFKKGRIIEVYTDGSFIERNFCSEIKSPSIIEVYEEVLSMPYYYRKLEKYTFKDVELEALEFNLPGFVIYYVGVKDFLKASKEWYSLDSRFYTVVKNGYKESCDNACGGLDVSWAFYKKRKGESVDKRTIKKMYKQLVREHVGDLLENLE